MNLPIRLILWAGNDNDHTDHLHVEGEPLRTGNPPLTNPGRTPAVDAIYKAMTARYGLPRYFLDPPNPNAGWHHMGWWNRRPIAGKKTWSQHAYSNALDIGPLIGVTNQRPIYDFLTREVVLMSWQKPGDTVNTIDDVKRVHAWQGHDVLTPADIAYDENDPVHLDERLKIVTARLLSELMAMDLRKADR